MLRVTAAMLALLVLAGGVGHATCQGWAASRIEREACCRRAHHTHGAQQLAADDCCAGHQDARQLSGPTFSQVAAPVSAVAVRFQPRALDLLSTPVVVVERALHLLHQPSPPPRPLRV